MRIMVVMILGIVALYYFTFLAFGGATLGKRLVRDSNSTFHEFRWTNSVHIVSNVNMKSVSEKFTCEDTNVQTIEGNDDAEIRLHMAEGDVYHYILLRNSEYLPIITVEETEQINEYVADWEKVYIWCFVAW